MTHLVSAAQKKKDEILCYCMCSSVAAITGFSVSLFCGSFFLGALRSALRNSVVLSAAVISF